MCQIKMLPGILKRQSSLLKSISAFSFSLHTNIAFKVTSQTHAIKTLWHSLTVVIGDFKKGHHRGEQGRVFTIVVQSSLFFIDRTKTVRLGKNYFFDFWRT